MYCYEVKKVYNELEGRFEDIQNLQQFIIIMSFSFSEAKHIEDISL